MKVLLVDDHEVLRDGVKRIFEQGTKPAVFGEASTAAEALQMAAQEDWDIILLDLSLRGGRSGLDVLKELRTLRPRAPVLVLSMHSEEQYARRAFKAGAAGYVTKHSSRAELSRAIATVLTGHRYISPELAERLIAYLEVSNSAMLHESLSDREFEVMRLIASGKTVGEIAAVLNVSDKTVSTYRARVVEKTGLKTNAEFTRYIFANNLLE